jgi:hypothetical protein
MTDHEKITLAFDVLEDAQVVQELGEYTWLKVDRKLWLEFINAGGKD